MKAHYILVQNIRALLHSRGASGKDLAMFAGHKPAWLSKILAGHRGVQFDDLDKIADFFGLTQAELFQYGIAPVLERRRTERRGGVKERRGLERRSPVPLGEKRHAILPTWRPKVPK